MKAMACYLACHSTMHCMPMCCMPDSCDTNLRGYLCACVERGGGGGGGGFIDCLQQREDVWAGESIAARTVFLSGIRYSRTTLECKRAQQSKLRNAFIVHQPFHYATNRLSVSISSPPAMQSASCRGSTITPERRQQLYSMLASRERGRRIDANVCNCTNTRAQTQTHRSMVSGPVQRVL